MYRVIVALSMWGVLAATANAGEIPDVVLRYADAFAQTHPEPVKLPPGVTLREEYAKHFFNGFVYKSGGAFSDSPMARDAYSHGLRYSQDHLSERDRIFAAYGYVAVERDGVWSRFFERNSFSPSDADEQSWWMTPLDDDAWRDFGRDRFMKDGDDRVRVVGYLSPRGHYGHLGGYSHEVFFTSVRLIDAGSASSK